MVRSWPSGATVGIRTFRIDARRAARVKVSTAARCLLDTGNKCTDVGLSGVVFAQHSGKLARARPWRLAATRALSSAAARFAGLALALALRQGLGPDVPRSSSPIRRWRRGRAAIRAPPRSSPPAAVCSRRSASGTRSRPHAQPILDMIVTDSRAARCDAAGVPHLRTARSRPGEPFAHMVENRHLIDALVQRARSRRRSICAPRRSTRRGATDATRHRDARRRQPRIDARCWSPPTAPTRSCASAPASRPRLGVRPVRHRRHGRARTRPQRPRRGAFSARRPVRDPAADRQALVAGLDRDAQRGRAHRRAAGRSSSIASSSSASGCSSARSRRSDKPRAFPLGYFVARSFVARAAGAGRRRRACHPPDRRARASISACKDVAALAEVDRRRGAARARSRARPTCWSATSAGGASTPWRWASRPTSLNRLFSNDVDAAARGARHRARPRRPLPPLKDFFIRQAAGLDRRGAAAAEGRGAVAC